MYFSPPKLFFNLLLPRSFLILHITAPLATIFSPQILALLYHINHLSSLFSYSPLSTSPLPLFYLLFSTTFVISQLGILPIVLFVLFDILLHIFRRNIVAQNHSLLPAFTVLLQCMHFTDVFLYVFSLLLLLCLYCCFNITIYCHTNCLQREHEILACFAVKLYCY